MHPKDADGIANSVDPDQTASSEAVWSWSALFAETYLSQYIEFIRYTGKYDDLPMVGFWHLAAPTYPFQFGNPEIQRPTPYFRVCWKHCGSAK